MTDGFRAETRRGGRLFLPALILVPLVLAADAALAGVQLAQDGPVRLMPRRDWSTPPAQDTPPSPQLQVEPAQPPDIQVKDLGTVDPEAVGTLDSSTGGLGPDMWSGTPRAVIRRLIGAIPAEMRSPVMRLLAERLLLTAAAMPPAAEDAAAEKGPSMLAVRAGRLQAMGLVDAAKALIQASPLRARDPELVRLLVENRLLASDLGGACADARGAEPKGTIFWQRVTVFCQILAGDNDGAQLGANVLAETPGFDDAAFLALVDVLTQKSAKATIEALPKPDALHLAMLRSAKADLPPDALDKAAPDILRAIGISPNVDLDLRLRAAEQAALAGAIAVPRLAQIYMSVKFSDAELNKALSTASQNWTPRGRALLYRAARSQSVPTAQAAVIQKAFELGRRDGQLLLLVRLYHDMLKGIPVSADMAWFAGEAAKGLLALGDREAASPWLTLLRERQLRDADARIARDRVWALALLAGDDRVSIDDRDAMAAWIGALREQEPEQADERAGFALVLLQAVGLPVPEGYWQTLLQPPQRVPVLVPPPAFVPALENAVRAGRIGETVLLSILMIGPDGTLGADPALLRDVIAALRSVGLERECRALALEAALTNGL